MGTITDCRLDSLLVLSGERCYELVNESVVVIFHMKMVLYVVNLLENVIEFWLDGLARHGFDYCQVETVVSLVLECLGVLFQISKKGDSLSMPFGVPHFGMTICICLWLV